MTLAPILPAVPASALKKELARLTPVTQFRGLEVFRFHAEECPQVMTEVGRLREKIFRGAGAGRGEPIDVDVLDFGETAYEQLVAFDPVAAQLVAMVRFQRGSRAVRHGDGLLRTSTLFDYSSTFRETVLPQGVELGRSVVNAESARSTVGLFALWRGLGRLAAGSEPFGYFFGNVTLYKEFAAPARDLLVATVEHHYAPPRPLFLAKPGLRLTPSCDPAPLMNPRGLARDRVKQLQALLLPHQERVPSILQSYLSLSTGVWCGQTAQDADFGAAHEMAIVVPLERLEPRVRKLFGLDE